MKFISYNIIAILLVLLTALMVYTDKNGWGWVLFAALICTVIPATIDDDNNK